MTLQTDFAQIRTALLRLRHYGVASGSCEEEEMADRAIKKLNKIEEGIKIHRINPTQAQYFLNHVKMKLQELEDE